MVINSEATFKVRLPSASEFDHATEDGDKAHVRFVLPGVVRAGVEVRPADGLRVEAAWVHEFWSAHNTISAVPEGITIDGVTGLPPPFGAAHLHPARLPGLRLVPPGRRVPLRRGRLRPRRARGFAYETSGIQQAYVSPLNIDSSKVLAFIGGGLFIGKHWRLDAVYSHVFASDVTVSPQDGAVPRVNPVPGNPTRRRGERGPVQREGRRDGRRNAVQVLGPHARGAAPFMHTLYTLGVSSTSWPRAPGSGG